MWIVLAGVERGGRKDEEDVVGGRRRFEGEKVVESGEEESREETFQSLMVLSVKMWKEMSRR